MPDILRLNSLNPAIFAASAAENPGALNRKNIVAAGRLMMVERAGRGLNALRQAEGRGKEYTCLLSDTKYAETGKNLREKMCLFAAKIAAEGSGEIPPADYGEFMRNQRKFMQNGQFLAVLSGLIRDIVTPTLPVCMSNALRWLCQTVSVPIGQTYEIDIQPNSIFVFEDDSWGASGSKPRNHGYVKPVTLNPRPRTAAVSIKWYQLIGNDTDIGALLNSIQAGLYNKIVALWYKAMKAGIDENAGIIPAGLNFETYSTANVVKAVKKVRMLTGFQNVLAVGDIEPLSRMLPSGNANAAAVNLDAALTEMLGLEYARYGYIGETGGARLMPIDNVVVPGTQNTSVKPLIDDNTVYFVGAGSRRPIYVGFEEGTPITIEMEPSKTADMTLDVQVTASMDAVPVFADKIAVMHGV